MATPNKLLKKADFISMYQLETFQTDFSTAFSLKKAYKKSVIYTEIF